MNRQSAQPPLKPHAPLIGNMENFSFNQKEKNETAICKDCGAVYENGAWKWVAHPPQDASSVLCVACQRMHEKQPASVVTIQGKFSREHSDELLALVRQIEFQKKSENPLLRIMSMDKRAEKLSIATTDSQLARSIGKALQQQYKGRLDFNYHRGEPLLRVLWQR
jgi:NMD protein affecting ribosome stability and mRNA decay